MNAANNRRQNRAVNSHGQKDAINNRKQKILKHRSPIYYMTVRFWTYIFFNIFLSICPILLNYFISSFCNFSHENAYSYCPDICFMIIITSSITIRDVYTNKKIYRKKLVSGGLTAFNAVLIGLSLVIYSLIIAMTELSPNGESIITFRHFELLIGLYIVSIIFGLGVHVGGGIYE